MEKPTFPIHSSSRRELPRGPQTVPFWVVEAHEAQALRNHGQTVARLKEWQGLSWCELHAVLSDRLWQRMGESDAMVECVSMIRRVDPVWYEKLAAILLRSPSF
jgi:hypothetical protein